VAGAQVALQDRTGTTVDAPPTDADGAAACFVPTHLLNAAGLMSLTPVTVTVTADGQSGRVVLEDPPTDHVSVTLPVTVGAPAEAPKPPPAPAPKPRRSKSSPARPISVP
jgi:hypothetical protein